MVICVCLIAYLLIIVLLSTYSNPSYKSDSFLELMVVASVAWMTFLLVITEILGLFNGLRFDLILMTWLIFIISLCYFIYRRRDRLIPIILVNIKPPDSLSSFLLSIIVLMIICSGLMAIFSPPNNIDCLSYHLSRQIYWIQQASLDHYYTINDRQIMMPPLAEIIGMHFMILSGGDYWAKLPQWLSYILAAICASIVAKDLGCNTLGQLFSAFCVIMIPCAFHQASNCKNDILLGLLILVLGWQAIRYVVKEVNFGLVSWGLVGANLGLIFMVKGTGPIFAFPIVLFLGLKMLRRIKFEVWKPLIIIILSLFILCLGHYSRNYFWYGSPIANNEKYTVAKMSGKFFFSNIIRNLSLHLGTPNKAWNSALNEKIGALHDYMGIDINDPQTTFMPELVKFNVVFKPRFETKAPAPIHILIMALVPCILLMPSVGNRNLWAYYCICVLQFGLFCFVFQWQPWHARLHIPFFCFSSPLIAVILTKIKQNQYIIVFISFFMFITALPGLLQSFSRPLLGSTNIFNLPRESLEYRSYPNWKLPQLKIYEIIYQLKPKCVKFSFEWAWQYPIQRRILNTMDSPPIFWGQTSLADIIQPEITICIKGEPCVLPVDSQHVEEKYKLLILGQFMVYVEKELFEKSFLIRSQLKTPNPNTASR